MTVTASQTKQMTSLAVTWPTRSVGWRQEMNQSEGCLNWSTDKFAFGGGSGCERWISLPFSINQQPTTRPPQCDPSLLSKNWKKDRWGSCEYRCLERRRKRNSCSFSQYQTVTLGKTLSAEQLGTIHLVKNKAVVSRDSWLFRPRNNNLVSIRIDKKI